jgi:hypothetical protein
LRCWPSISGIEVVIAATIAPVSSKLQSLSVMAARITGSCHSNGTDRRIVRARQ